MSNSTNKAAFVIGGKFVGITTDGGISLPKGGALPEAAQARQWRGNLLKLMKLHRDCTENGKETGREGVGGVGVAAAIGSNNQRYTVTEALDDKLAQHLGQWDILTNALLECAIDPVVFAVQRRIIHSEEILYSQLHRHLHHAVFADDDVIMLERMPRTSSRGRFEASDMIGLLCWLAKDIEDKVPDSVSLPANVHGLAEDFADRHSLLNDASLFDAPRIDTLNELRHLFEEIRRYHPPVDADTENIIEVIENYLFAGKKLESSGNDQHDNVVLGSDFFDIWEMLCLHHAYGRDINIDKDPWKVLIADSGNLPKWLRANDAFKNTLVSADVNDPKFSIYQGELRAIFNPQRPDLILYRVSQDTVTYRVIDFKYYEWADLRIKPDRKQLNDSEIKFFLGVLEDGILNLSKSDIAKSWGYAQSVLCWHNDNKLGKKISINMEFWLPSDNEKHTKRDYSVGELHAKRITEMINGILAGRNPFNL